MTTLILIVLVIILNINSWYAGAEYERKKWINANRKLNKTIKPK